MSQFRQIAISEFRKFARDSILMLVLLAPILILVIVRLGIPLISEVLYTSFTFQLDPYYPLIFIFFCAIFPLLFGMMAGFSLLDEQDEKVLQFIAITPLSRGGYLRTKFAVPTLATIPVLLIFAWLCGLFDGRYLRFLPMAILFALETPMMGMFLSGFANNKVEGLALGKAAGVFFAVPGAGYFLPSPWCYLTGLSPVFWPMNAYWSTSAAGYWTSLGIGIIMHAIVFWLLYRKFTRKVLQF